MSTILLLQEFYGARILGTVVLKFRFFLVPLFLAITIMFNVFLFYWPRMSLPSTERFKYFVDRHPIEEGFHDFKTNFDGAELNNAPLPLFVVFGIKPEDEAR